MHGRLTLWINFFGESLHLIVTLVGFWFGANVPCLSAALFQSILASCLLSAHCGSSVPWEPSVYFHLPSFIGFSLCPGFSEDPSCVFRYRSSYHSGCIQLLWNSQYVATSKIKRCISLYNKESQRGVVSELAQPYLQHPTFSPTSLLADLDVRRGKHLAFVSYFKN